MVAGDGVLGFIDHIFDHVGLGIGPGAIAVLGAAEAQDHLEDEGQQQQADAEACALVEGLGQVDLQLDGKINVIEWE